MLAVQDSRVYSLLTGDSGQEGRMATAPPVPRAPSGETPPPLWAESVMAEGDHHRSHSAVPVWRCMQQQQIVTVWSRDVTSTYVYIKYRWSMRANFLQLLKVTMFVLNMSNIQQFVSRYPN